MDLKNKRALITGGTSGMGSEAALSMAEKGASVIITGRDETRGASTVEKIREGGHDAQFIAADFLEMSEVERVADATGEIDVLVNCAGFAARGSTVDTDEAAFDGLASQPLLLAPMTQPTRSEPRDPRWAGRSFRRARFAARRERRSPIDDPKQLFCNRLAMEASADERPSLLLVVKGGSRR